MHFTKTVDLLDACFLGDFEMLCVGELTGFLKHA
jgi:hypothetical protein